MLLHLSLYAVWAMECALSVSLVFCLFGLFEQSIIFCSTHVQLLGGFKNKAVLGYGSQENRKYKDNNLIHPSQISEQVECTINLTRVLDLLGHQQRVSLIQKPRVRSWSVRPQIQFPNLMEVTRVGQLAKLEVVVLSFNQMFSYLQDDVLGLVIVEYLLVKDVSEIEDRLPLVLREGDLFVECPHVDLQVQDVLVYLVFSVTWR